MGKKIYRKTGDTQPPINAQLFDEDGQPADLTGSTVQFLATHVSSDSAAVINEAALVIDEESGRVRYTPIASDFDTAGEYDIEWEVTDSGGEVKTYPNYGHDTAIVTAQLGSAPGGS